jgi:flagellar basal-body rod modification protein FlgD
MIDTIAAVQANQNPRSSTMSDASSSSNSAMQMDDFLQLLTSQISNQDPLEPMKDTEFISQMANIASLEQMEQFTKGFKTFADSHKDMVAQAYLGKMVNITEDGKDVTGLVDSVEKDDDGKVFVTVGDKNYLPENITRVSNPSIPNSTNLEALKEKSLARQN